MAVFTLYLSGLNSVKSHKWFKKLQLVSSAIFSIGHGGNDAQKVMGIIAAAVAVYIHTSGVAQEINPQNSKLRVTGVACFNSNGMIVDKFGWSFLNNGNILVTIYFASGN